MNELKVWVKKESTNRDYRIDSTDGFLWPLPQYELPITVRTKIERIIIKKPRCLGLPKGLSIAVLDGTTNALERPFSRLTEEFVLTQVKEVLLYRNSRNINIKAA